jgi:hypothetical protein
MVYTVTNTCKQKHQSRLGEAKKHQSRSGFAKQGQACHRGRKNFIDQLEHQGTVVIDESLKAQVVFHLFDQIIGQAEPRFHGLDLQRLGLPSLPLALDQCLSEEEV